MISGCEKCQMITGALVLLAGIGLLLRDMAIWSFWGISWWTAAFIICGVTGIAMSKCKSCQK